jgi:PTH2 family peptidyl-tRNA hydrolase
VLSDVLFNTIAFHCLMYHTTLFITFYCVWQIFNRRDYYFFMLRRNSKSHSIRAGKIKQVILIRKDLDMGTGKIAAQASHASLESYLETLRAHPEIANRWLEEGQTKIVLKIKNQAEAATLKKELRDSGIPFKAVRDAGQTQVPPGTETAIGIGPYYETELDRITGDLPLL